MKQSVVIFDENTMHLAYLKQTIEACDSKGIFDISVFSEGVQLDRSLDSLHVDIAFIDMSMTGTNSVHLGRRIRERFPEAKIILVTESNSFELSAYELRASHYLVKPVMAHKIQAILDELLGMLEAQEDTTVKLKWFSIETKKRTIRVAFEDILFFEKDQRKVVVHTQAGTWDFYGTFKEIKELLDLGRVFVQCHQGYIVNIHRVAVIESDELKLDDGRWIPVSRRFRPAVEGAFEKSVLVTL